MSRTIDERVVSMQFDNSHFESNVRTSLGTIEKLKQSLNFKSASQGLENINRASKSCTLAPLSSAAETVKMKFSAMEVMAVTALANITNSAINTGKRMISALTIDPIKTGLSEYETQIGAIQTILANTESKGTTLDDVNAALDELNTYADKTIYNFTQMTRNIGTFTAAGVGLKESTQAIKGIANLAAVSGSTSQQASTAMYQLSQALAAGRVSLMDWNSVVNAGMGGEVFQNALKRTSRMLGTGVDEAIKKYGTFRESLTQGQWLTKEVLVETLAQLSGAYDKADLIAQGFTEQQANEILKLADTAEQAATKVKTFTQLWDTLKESAQSGWTQTWEYVLGDFEESKWFFSNLSDTIGGFIGKSAESRNNLLGEALSSNYDKLIGKLGEAGIEATDFENKVREVLTKHCYDVDGLIEKYGSLERAFMHGAIPAATLREALNDLGTAADISLEGIDRVLGKGTSGEDVSKVQKALKALGYDLGEFGEKADGVDGVLGNMTESAIKAFQAAHGLNADGIIGPETLAALEKAAAKTKTLGKEITDLIDGVNQMGGGELLRESISNVVKGVLNILSTIKSAWGEVFKIEPDQIYNVLDIVHNATEKFLNWTENNSEKIKMVFQGVFSVLGVAWDGLKAVLAGIWKIASPIFSALGKGLFTAVSSLGEWLVGLRESIIESGKFAKITDSVASAVEKVVNFVKRLGKPIWEWIFGSENDAEGQLTGLQQFIEQIKTFVSESKALDYIGEKFTNLGSKIRGYFTNLFTGEDGKAWNIKDTLSKVRDDIVNFFKDFSAEDILAKIRTFFSELGTKFKTDLLGALGLDGEDGQLSAKQEALVEKIKYYLQHIKNFFSEFSFEDAIAKLKENFAKIGPALRSFFSSIGETIAKFFGVSKEKFESIREAISGFFGGIFDFLDDNKGSIAALGTLIGIIALLKKINDAISTIGGIFDVDGIKEAIEGFVKSKEALNKAEASKIRTESIKNIAIAIGIIAASIYVIAKIPEDDLWRAVGVVGGIMAVVVVLTLLMKFINTNISFKAVAGIASFGALLASLGTALLLMTIAVSILGGMDRNRLIQGGLAVTYFVGLVVILMRASDKIGKGEVAAFGKMMKQLSVALLLLSAVVYIFGKMDTDTLIQGGLAVTYFLGVMAGVMIIAGTMDSDVKSFGKMIRSLSVSLLLLAGVVYIFGSMDTKTLIQGGLAVTTFLGIMIAAMALTKNASADAAKFGSMMLGIGASLILMAWAVKILGSMDTKTLIKGTMFIAGFAGIIVGLMAATKLMGKYSFNAGKMGLMLLSFSASILIIAGAIAALAMLDGPDIVKALAAIAGVGLIFAGLLAVTKYANAKLKVGTIIALAGAVAIMAASVAALAFVPKEKLITATACLSVLTGMFALLAYTSKFATMKSVGSIALMALIVGGIGLLFAKLSEGFEHADQAVKAATAIGILVTAISASALMLSKIGRADGNQKGLYAGIGVFAALAGVVALFAVASVEYLPRIADRLSTFMTKLDPFISGMDKIDRSMVSRIKILGEAMSAFAGAGAKFAIADFFTLGGVSKAFDGFIEFIREIIPVITEAALMASVFDIDFTNLDSIIKAVTGLAEAASMVPVDVVGGAITKWGAGGFAVLDNLGAFTQFVTGIIPIIQGFAIELNTANIDSKAVGVVRDLFEAVKILAEAAAEAPGIEMAAGLAKFKGGYAGGGLVSVPDLYAFTSYVKGIFEALKDFIPEISGTVPKIPIEFITGIFSAIKTLGEAAAEAPSTTVGAGFAKFGKLVGIFGGANWTDLDAFRKYLVGDGENKGAIDAVKDFINGIDYAKFNVKGLDAKKIGAIMDGISTVINAISEIGKAADAAPKTTIGGGLGAGFSKLAKAFGFGVGGYYSTTDLAAFKEYLLGDDGAIAAVKEFINGIDPSIFKGIGPEKTTAIMSGISNVITAISALASAAGDAPKNIDAHGIGGFGGWLGGLMGGFGKVDYVQTTDLEAFRTWLIGADGKGGMMSALTGFIDIFEDKEMLDAIQKIGSNTDGINTVISAVSTLATLANSAPKTIDAKGGFAGIFGSATANIIGGGIGGGGGEYHSVTDLEKFTDWITQVTPVLKDFVVDTSGITIPDGSALETVLTAIDTIATAASNVQVKTEGWAVGFAMIGSVPVGAFGIGSSSADYEGFIGLIESLGTSDGPLAKLLTAVSEITFDGSVDSADMEKLTAVLTAVDSLAAASSNIPMATEFTTLSGILATYKTEGPDFEGFAEWVTSMTGEDGQGGIVKLITDANNNLPSEGELDISKITNLCYVVNELAKAAEVIPDTSLWGEIFSGVTNFDGFAAFVETIGTEVTKFATTIADSTIEDVDLSKILSMANVLKTLAEVGNLLSSGGYVDVSVFGIADNTEGKTPIDYIVDAVVSAKTKLAELGEGDLAALETAANAINAFANVLVTVGGKMSVLYAYSQDGSADLFNQFVTDIATALNSFTTQMEGVNLDRLSIASTAVNLIANTLTQLSTLEYGSVNTALFKTTLSEIATALSEFEVNFESTNITTAVSTVATVTSDLSTALSKDFSGAGAFKDALDTLASIDSDLSGLSGLSDTLGDVGANAVESLASAFEGGMGQVKSAGTSIADGLARALETRLKLVSKVAKSGVSSAATAVKNNYNSFYGAGKFLGDGLIAGIKAKMDAVYQAAYALGQKAVQGEKDGQQSASPSKATIKAGKWLGEGLIIGINRMGNAVYDAGKTMGAAATDSISKSIQTISEFIDSDIDAQPTIRPVLDLSEVEAGANGISDMFGVNPSVALMSNIGSINSMMNRRQNGSNDDVISAIKDLGRKIGNTSGNTYQINGITYDDGSNITDAVATLVRAARVERRI